MDTQLFRSLYARADFEASKAQPTVWSDRYASHAARQKRAGSSSRAAEAQFKMTNEEVRTAELESTECGDRRSTDRRSRPTRPWDGFLTPMRRTGGRRAEDQASYVDRYTKRDVILLLTIFLLNVGDAFLTLMWLNRGGKEANPVMDFFLDIGPGAFLIQKCLVVGAWLILLLAHKNFRFARLGLYASLAVYSLLMLVHFGILYFGVEPPNTQKQAESLSASAQAPITRFQGSPTMSPIRDDVAAWRPGRAITRATAAPFKPADDRSRAE
jgi:hypothetical protein